MTAREPLIPSAVDPACFTLVPLPVAKRLRAVPVAVDGDRVTVAMVDPNDIFALDDLHLALPAAQLSPVAEDAAVVNALLSYWERTAAAAREGAAVAEISREREGTDVEAVEVVEDGRLARLVGQVLDQATAVDASDVHFEPVDGELRIRFRIDGVLHPHATHPGSLTSGVINRLKLLAELDTANRRVPQDGRFTRSSATAKVDYRVVTTPTAWGDEGAVVRLFDQGRGVRTLAQIGFAAELRARFEAALATPHGALLVTGPTGHGKTTTLYGALSVVATPDRKTLAIEDPTEIRFPSITQLQVNEKADLTFGTALRAFLRADPDVILVGEIRDEETAQLASRAAMTGHQVLTTVHTNSALGAPARLADLGLKPYIVTQAVRAILAQRLVRRLCQICRVEYVPTEAELAAAGWPEDLPRPERLYRAGSQCLECGNRGYRGRFAVGELVVVDDDLADAIVHDASTRDLARLAVAGGTVPMRVDALRHVDTGLTTLAELTRVGV